MVHIGVSSVVDINNHVDARNRLSGNVGDLGNEDAGATRVGLLDKTALYGVFRNQWTQTSIFLPNHHFDLGKCQCSRGAVASHVD